MKMKAVCAAAGMLFACHAFAQSSVTISGLIDGGVSYVSNQGGGSVLKFDDGIAVPNLLKFSGKEDLGGGTRAVFELTNQFELGSGAFMPGQSLFSRTAFVGLDDDRFGRLTLGNQYDFMTDSLFFGYNDAAIYAAGIYDFRNGPFDKLALPANPTGAFDWDRMAGERITNSVKYQSASFNGFSAGAMYGFGGVPGSIGAGNASSFGLNYVNGAFGANAAYTLVKTATPGGQDSVRNWGVGTHYHLGAVTLTGLFTTVRNNLNGAGIWQVEAGTAWQINPFLSLSGAYSYMKGNAVVDDNHAHQLTAMLQYFLSKRTSVYVATVYQRANEGANAQINDVMVASSSASQFIGRIGMQTHF
ncbi:porin [Paraburkholderia gardini]|uniref:Outer membrane porin protein 32 n=1 Tax=Paraburkholderia gardini TaxID=2823469 RepID=A0ABN7QLJ5_9BURK|nr:porin [Paraburkholderia gardini]CAG4897157.1 Outer membrane porin protein 32 [Paraburkholderia gardini]